MLIQRDSMPNLDQSQNVSKNMRTFMGLLGIFLLGTLAGAFSVQSTQNQQQQYIYTPTTRVEVCINTTQLQSIHMITNLPFNSSLSSNSYGWATLNDVQHYTGNESQKKYLLEHNNLLC